MIPIILSRFTTRRGHVARRIAKSLLLLLVIGCVMAVSSCKDDGSMSGLEFTADLTPIGEGLRVIGFAVLGSAVVIALGRILTK